MQTYLNLDTLVVHSSRDMLNELTFVLIKSAFVFGTWKVNYAAYCLLL